MSKSNHTSDIFIPLGVLSKSWRFHFVNSHSSTSPTNLTLSDFVFLGNSIYLIYTSFILFHLFSPNSAVVFLPA
jgi:hypothetical protein